MQEISGGFSDGPYHYRQRLKRLSHPGDWTLLRAEMCRCFGIWDLGSAVPYAVIAESVLKHTCASACHLCCQVGTFFAELPNCGVGAEGVSWSRELFFVPIQSAEDKASHSSGEDHRFWIYRRPFRVVLRLLSHHRVFVLNTAKQSIPGRRTNK